VGTNQIHDYNPGIAENGLFWTMAVPDGAVDVNSGAGRARFAMSDLAIPDLGDFVNAILPGSTSTPATVSFDVQWHDIQSRYNESSSEFGLAGEFVVTNATIEWSSVQEGFSFQSDPASTSKTDYAIVGHERNGVFFQ
jgi:hypothetical protein